MKEMFFWGYSPMFAQMRALEWTHTHQYISISEPRLEWADGDRMFLVVVKYKEDDEK